MKRAALRAILIGPALISAAIAEPARRGWTIGTDGWSLEQFGPQITVLRSRVAVPPAREPTLFLSCALGEKRLRITFPEPVPGAVPDTGGTALVRRRPRNAADAAGTIGPFQAPSRHQIEFRDPRDATEGIIAGVTRLLQTPGGEIEVLLWFGARPPTLGRGPIAYTLQLLFGPGDVAMLAHVAAACTPHAKRSGDG